MTTIGKILVVLHLVLSIMFMAFAGAVYTAQKNWRTAEQAAQTKLAAAERTLKDNQAETEKLKNDHAQASVEFGKEIERLKALNTGLETDVRTLTADNKQLRKEVDQLRDQAVLTTTEAVERKKEADLQREKNGLLFESRESLESKLTEALDKGFALEVQVQQMTEKYEGLLQDNKTMKSFLSSKELTTDPKQMAALNAPPPPLHGRVLDVLKPDRRSKQEYVEISIGRDSGLEVGHTLTVYRGEKYLGQLRLTMVEADKSVGIVKSRAKNAEFQVGDEVTTRF